MENLMTPEFKNFLKEAITEVLEEKSSNLHNKELLSTNEALEFLGIKKGHLYKLTMDKKIPFSKPTGKMMYFKKSDLIAFQASNFTVKLDGNILASNVNKITQSLKK
jgi:excisionase family DNA binding protein